VVLVSGVQWLQVYDLMLVDGDGEVEGGFCESKCCLWFHGG